MLLTKAIQNSAIAIGLKYLGVAIGTGTAAAAITDNALGTETQRVASTNTIVTTTIASDTSQHSGDFTISSPTVALTEAGVCTTSTTGGDFAARQVFSPMNFVLNDNVVFVFKFKTSG
jgi:hypothetical protein